MKSSLDCVQITQELLLEWRKNDANDLPTSVQVYHLGLTLYALNNNNSHDATAISESTLAAFEQLLLQIPTSVKNSIFGDIKEALFQLLPTDDIGIQSAVGLCQCTPVIDFMKWTLQDLYEIIDSCSENNKELVAKLANQLLFPLTGNSDEKLLQLINKLQEYEVWNAIVEENDSNAQWKTDLLAVFDNGDMREYAKTLIEKTDSNDTPTSFVKKDEKSTTTLTAKLEPMSPTQELQRRIDQVREILPHLGEGYVEVILSHFGGNVESTTAALLEGNLPPALARLDQDLPRRKRETDTKYTLQDEDREFAKAQLRALQEQQEREALLIQKASIDDPIMNVQRAATEYDDDYDDTYDDMAPATDSGLYDQDDFEAIRAYNKALLGIEADQSFWEENKNTNRQQKSVAKKKDDDNTITTADNDESENTEDTGNKKRYRGPDKGRGGRISGRGGRGRGREGPTNTASKETSSATETAEKKEQVKPTKSGQKYKDQKLANRRDRQKKAVAKRVG